MRFAGSRASLPRVASLPVSGAPSSDGTAASPLPPPCITVANVAFGYPLADGSIPADARNTGKARSTARQLVSS